jgi:hypothetical protein
VLTEAFGWGQTGLPQFGVCLWLALAGRLVMARKTGVAPGIILLLGFGWLISKCNGGGSSTVVDPVPLTSPSAISAPSVEPLETMFVSAAALNQRSAPDGSVVSKLSGGDPVNIYERHGNWARVSPENAAPLWVSSSHLCSGVSCYSPALARSRSNTPARRPQSNYTDGTCPCSGGHVCVGPRGGRYCITSGGKKRYGV